MFHLMFLLACASADHPPLASDLYRFPSAEFARRQADAAGDFRDSCYARANVAAWSFEREYWQMAAYETERLQDIWLHLVRAYDYGSYDGSYWLLELKGSLGIERWRKGKMPPAIPFWRLERID